MPHYLVLFELSMAAIAVLVAGSFAVLITGEYPQSLHDFLVAVYRYSVRVQAYSGLLTDRVRRSACKPLTATGFGRRPVTAGPWYDDWEPHVVKGWLATVESHPGATDCRAS